MTQAEIVEHIAEWLAPEVGFTFHPPNTVAAHGQPAMTIDVGIQEDRVTLSHKSTEKADTGRLADAHALLPQRGSGVHGHVDGDGVSLTVTLSTTIYVDGLTRDGLLSKLNQLTDSVGRMGVPTVPPLLPTGPGQAVTIMAERPATPPAPPAVAREPDPAPTAERKKRRRWPIVVLLLAIAGSGSFLLYSYLTSDGRPKARETVTPSGGVVATDDGLTLNMPPGAVSGTGQVSVYGGSPRRPLEESMFVGVVEVGRPYRIEMTGAEITSPFGVELPYDPSALPGGTAPDQVFAAYLDRESGIWVPVAGHVDEVRQVVIVKTEELSWWQSWTWDYEVASSAIESELTRVLAFSDTPMASPLDCDEESWPPGIEISSAFDPDWPGVLSACVEKMELPSDAVLSVKNNAVNGVLLEAPEGFTVAGEGSAVEPWAEAALPSTIDGLRGSTIYFSPNAEGSLALRFTEPTAEVLSIDLSNSTVALDMTQGVFRALGAFHIQVIGVEELAACALEGAGAAADLAGIFSVIQPCSQTAIPGLATVLANVDLPADSAEFPFTTAQLTVAYGGPPTIEFDGLELFHVPETATFCCLWSVAASSHGLAAVGQRGAWLSPDGESWSHVEIGSGLGNEPQVTVGGPGFVAIGYEPNNDIDVSWLSSDGMSWTRGGEFDHGFAVEHVTTWGSRLVAVGVDWRDPEEAAVWISTSGSVWDRISDDSFRSRHIGGHARMNSVTSFGPGLVAVGTDDGNAAVWWSVEGRVWFRGGGELGDGIITSVTRGGPGLVAVGTDGNAVVWWSRDGKNWTRVPYDADLFGGSGQQIMTGVAAGSSGILAAGWDDEAAELDGTAAAVWWSRDGINWIRVPHDEDVLGGPWPDSMSVSSVVAWGSGFVIVGGEGSKIDFHAAAVWLVRPADG